MIRQVEYFERPGRENTARCLQIVSELWNEGFSHLVVVSTAGETGLLFARKLEGRPLNMVAVTHNVGYAGPNQDECSSEARQEVFNHK